MVNFIYEQLQCRGEVKNIQVQNLLLRTYTKTMICVIGCSFVSQDQVFCLTSSSFKLKTLRQGVTVSHKLENGWMQEDFGSLLAPPLFKNIKIR